MTGIYLCETCFDAMTGHVVDVRGFEEAICDDCIGGSKVIILKGWPPDISCEDFMALWEVSKANRIPTDRGPDGDTVPRYDPDAEYRYQFRVVSDSGWQA